MINYTFTWTKLLIQAPFPTLVYLITVVKNVPVCRIIHTWGPLRWIFAFLFSRDNQMNKQHINNSMTSFLRRRRHGPLTRYAKFRVAHAPGMLWTFSPPRRVSDPDVHHGTCVGSLTSGFLWRRWRGKRSRHSRRMRDLQFCVSGKRPIMPCEWSGTYLLVVAHSVEIASWGHPNRVFHTVYLHWI